MNRNCFNRIVSLFLHVFASLRSFFLAALIGFAISSASASSLEITQGGTYGGSWSSDDCNTPAITIRTTEPVIIENADVHGRGDLIATRVEHAKVIIRNTRGVGENPGVAGRSAGRFFTGEACDSVTIEHCDLQGTCGVYLLGYGGDFSPSQTIAIRFNRAKNIDGRKSDGRGGYLDFNRRSPVTPGPAEKGYVEAQFLQLDKVRHVPGIDIGWNQINNEAGASRVEDNISLYLSSGTPQSPIRIHDNFIRGAYTIRPWQPDTVDDDYRYDWSYSGGGIMLGDGSASQPQDAAAFAVARDNQIVSTTNYGIAIAAGHDLSFFNNRIISSGKLPDGRPIFAQNVGAYIWDAHHGSQRDQPTFYNNRGHDNSIVWMKRDRRNDAWHPDAKEWTNNHSLSRNATREDEEAEWKLWTEKLARAQISIGASRAR